MPYIWDIQLRFGFAHIPSFQFGDSLGLIQEAETIGYDVAWLPDQPFYLDPYPILTAAAGATSDIQLGVGVTNPFTTHPVMTARMAATVDQASSGRLRLGLGTGNRREFLKPLGYEGKRFGVEWCREAIPVIRDLWAGKKTTQPAYFVADGAQLSFAARQDIPIYIAGIGKKILGLAGESADGAIINFVSPRALEIALSYLKAGRSAARSEASSEIVAWGTTLITENDRTSAYDRLRPFIAHSLAPTSRDTLHALGLDDSRIDALREDYREYGPDRAAQHVSDELIDDFSWVGPPEALADRIQGLSELGVTEIAIIPFTRDLDEMRSIVREFAGAVRPRLA